MYNYNPKYYQSSRNTIKSLRNEVDKLNKKFKKTNRTAVKFDIHSAYGGHQIVIKDNKTGGVQEVTFGYDSPKKVIDKVNSLSDRRINYDLKRFHKYAMDRRKNRW